MKKQLLIVCCFLLSFLCHAQSPFFQWAKRMGSTNIDAGQSIAIDAFGNVFTTGYFHGTVDFDPGVGVFTLTSGNGGSSTFISKLDISGNFIWAINLGQSEGYSMTLDSLGNIYVTGFFGGTADFDPGVGIYNLTSSGDADIFICKFNSNGNLLWAKSMGGPVTDNGNSIAVDALGNVYTTGFFEDTADFDPGPGTFTLSAVGIEDIFVVKLDTSGNYLWAKSIGGVGWDAGSTIKLDKWGNVLITGYFEGTVDFDPGIDTVGLISSGSTDIYILKLNPDGNFAWAKKIGGTQDDQGTSLTVDAFGDVYATGTFMGTADFDPGAGTFNMTAIASQYYWDIFILKLDDYGNFIWAKDIGGPSTSACSYCIQLDMSGNIYTTGTYEGTLDFDPGPGTYTLTAKDIFISKLDNSGNFVWAKNMGNQYSEYGSSLALDSAGNIYTTGSYYGTVDFDPGIGVFNLTTDGSLDIFIHKMSQCAPNVNVTVGNSTICQGSSVVLTANGANNYLWNTGAATESICVSPTITTTYTVTGINSNGCFNTQTLAIDVSVCADINNTIISGQSNIKLYPNPLSGILYVNTEGPVDETVSIQLINTLGQVVFTCIMNSKAESFDISTLPKGVYFAALKQNGSIKALKVVKE